MNSQEEKRTLSNADITSRRAATRRSFLGMLGIGLGVGAAALVAVTTPADAAKKKGRRLESIDGDAGNYDAIIVHDYRQTKRRRRK